jgi:broad specificity polyphosphatase/5'/3'-nucleotidase SurE
MEFFMKNILLVNDDGYYAEGLQRLKAKLYPYGNVYTVAPMGAMSAKSVSITVDHKACSL